MISNCVRIPGNLEESFLEIQERVREEFWKTVNQHNYKQIIVHDDEENIHLIRNEKDWESFKQKGKIYLAFIPKHFTSIDEAIRHAAPFYRDISCNGCAIQPTIGTLYKCFECPNFHLCEVCVADQQHSHHMMFSTKKPPINANLSADIHCESCGVKPITGIRYKCISCKDRDFCESCFKLKLLPCKDHTMIRFSQRDGEAAAGAVVSQTNVQSVEDNQLKIMNNKLDKLMEKITLLETKVFNIDGDSAGKANEKSHQQEEKTDESQDVNRTVHKAD